MSSESYRSQVDAIVQRPHVPWFSREIREAKRQGRKAEKRWRKSRLESDLAAFIAKRDFTTRVMNKSRREFYSNFIDENSGDQKKLFRASQCLFNRTMDDGLPPNLDSSTFSKDLGKFFVQKIDTICTQLDTNQQTDSYPEDDTSSADETVPPFPTFTMLSVQDC